MFSNAWADSPSHHDHDPQPPSKPSLSLSAAHAHAFSTPKGWEPPQDHRDSPPVDDLVPASALAQHPSDKPKWVLPYRRYDAQDLPYTAWEAVASPAESDTPRGRLAPRRASSTCSAASYRLNDSTPRAGGSDLSRAALNEAKSLSSYKTPKRTWEWANQVIPDPDYPDGSPSCLSPRPSSVASSSKEIKKFRMTKSAGDVDLGPEAYFDLPIQPKPFPDRLAVSEVSVFGSVGTVDSVFGPKQPDCGLCRCDGMRIRYRVHGETCPLHIRAMRIGPTALKAESGL